MRRGSRAGDETGKTSTGLSRPRSTARPPEGTLAHRGRWTMLVMATVGFGVNFWAWALLSPLAPQLKETLGLTPFQQAAVVAVPVIVGSLGRIPIGAMTDRFGGRLMFPLVSVCTAIPVVYLGLLGVTSLSGLLIGGFFLGLGGTSFAIGIPFVTLWFPPRQRGLALGLFGTGMAGTAIGALTTVPLAQRFGAVTPFTVVTVALILYAGLALLLIRDPEVRPIPVGSLGSRVMGALRLPITGQASILYALSFGGYVAFSVYLPAYLRTAYGLTTVDAANRTAGFVLLAVAMRPVGGWLADRVGPVPVLSAGYGIVIAGAGLQTLTPELIPLGTVACLGMAAALGLGTGATFALVALLAPPVRVGAVTGVVGAAGGIGGFVPPLLMGTVYGWFGGYALGLALLAVAAAGTLTLTATIVRRELLVRSPTALLAAPAASVR